MNNNNFTVSANTALNNACTLAYRTGGEVGTEHILYGILGVKDCVAARILTRVFNITIDKVSNYIPRRGAPVASIFFTYMAEAALEKSVVIARELGSDYVGTEHLLVAILKQQSLSRKIVRSLGVDPDEIVEHFMDFLKQSQKQDGDTQGHLDNKMDVELSDEAGYLLDEDEKNSGTDGDNKGGNKGGNSGAFGFGNISSSGDFFDLFSELVGDMGSAFKFDKSSADAPKMSQNQKPTEKPQRPEAAKPKYKSDMPKELDDLGADLTARAKNNQLDPVIGRTTEIERIIQTLCRRTKNNPVLIGEAGVGKSAVVEGLAQKIVNGEVPDLLKDKKIFSLDMGSVVAGTKYRGEFEEKFKNALNAIKNDGNIILFIDEIHTIVKSGAGDGGALDAANILKPMLARGEIQTVGATTLDEYRKYIEKDAALERRFQPVVVDQPTVAETIEILKGLRSRYEEHHGVEITDDAISSAAILSDRYVSDRFLPDKAIDIIDEAASRKRLYSFTTPEKIKELGKKIAELSVEKDEAKRREQFVKAQKLKEEIDVLQGNIKTEHDEWKKKVGEIKLSIGEEEVAEIVSNWTGVPLKRITEDESEKLLHLEETLSKRVIGQNEAVSSVARAIKRARAGLKDPKRPIGSFIFLGPTGVGKTELSKALADVMFGDENMLIRVDMSEYMEKHNVSKMIGSAPGYVGYDEGGQLTEKVRRKPYSVVLFDEIEKAHPDVFNVLLQILDDGRLTDSHGRTVNFKNTIIIMTSNIGASEISRVSLGFSGGSAEEDYERMKEKQMSALKKTFKPEFINRVDDIIIFSKLAKDDIKNIAKLMIANLAKRLKERDITFEIAPAAEDLLIEKGYDKEYGARPLKRTIQKLLEDRLSEEILKGSITTDSHVLIDVKDGVFTFTPAKAASAKVNADSSESESSNEAVDTDSAEKADAKDVTDVDNVDAKENKADIDKTESDDNND